MSETTTAPPLVSVVMPAYNSGRTIASAIRSALAQTVSSLEVVVVDDGSADDTAERAKSIADPRVRVFLQPNGGAAAARNTGLAEAQGTWVAFLDADDLWLPHKLERQLATLERRPDVFAVQSGVYTVDNELNLISVEAAVDSEDTLLDFLRFRNMPGVMSTFVIARHLFEEMGGFDTELTILEEWDMSLKAARYCNAISIPEPLALYRVYAGNRSRDLDIHIRPGFRVLERVFADPELPAHVRARKREIYARFYTMLCGGAFKIHRWREVAKWGARAAITDPRTLGYMAALPLRRLRRRRSRSDRQAGWSDYPAPSSFVGMFPGAGAFSRLDD